jgi:ABC-type nitrate/sulfonate/bicarbonate transport system substrate-binding protein
MQQRWHSRETFNGAIIIRVRSNAVIALVVDGDGLRTDSISPAKAGLHGWGRAATFALVLLLLLPVPLRAEKIRTVVPQSSLNYLSVYVAESKGYFQREGFDHETLVLAGPVAAAALVSGNVDFGGGGGSAMRAAASGAPLKAIFFQTDKVTAYLVTDPSIAKAADLKGKKVGVGGIGSSQDRMILAYVEQAGLAASDITRINMGADASRRILAIKQGAINATILDPGTLIFAEREGLRTLAFLGDLFPFPFQAFATTDKKLLENPEQVKRWLRAMVQALMEIRDNPEAAAEVALKRLRIGSVSRLALIEAIKHYNRAVSPGVPGIPSAEGIKNIIEYEIKLPLKIEGELAVEKVMNLRMIQQVKAELEKKKFCAEGLNCHDD